MTVEDIINFLNDESQEQTLSRQAIERCVLLVYDMGKAAQSSGAMRQDPFAYTNTWLAEMGYCTWRMVLEKEMPQELRETVPVTLEDSRPEVQHAWRAAAAAIRRRVVNHCLPAEEEQTMEEPAP